MKTKVLIVILAASVAAGCSYERESTTGPGSTGVEALMGTWGSNAVPSRDSCGNFSWNVTERTATSASGTFSATCANDLRIEGAARATLSGEVISWSADARATSVPIIGTCNIALTGTAELGVDSIRIPYSGTTCLGPVSGVETLHRR
ncbi:MAG TPA: hypothetical protein VHJ77_06210 [Vicinamibacterales bacterium]|jgi:hypothetical protein|nr:hypothetical protein [Vicinamibacterales bacterium]